MLMNKVRSYSQHNTTKNQVMIASYGPNRSFFWDFD